MSRRKKRFTKEQLAAIHAKRGAARRMGTDTANAEFGERLSLFQSRMRDFSGSPTGTTKATEMMDEFIRDRSDERMARSSVRRLRGAVTGNRTIDQSEGMAFHQRKDAARTHRQRERTKQMVAAIDLIQARGWKPLGSGATRLVFERGDKVLKYDPDIAVNKRESLNVRRLTKRSGGTGKLTLGEHTFKVPKVKQRGRILVMKKFADIPGSNKRAISSSMLEGEFRLHDIHSFNVKQTGNKEFTLIDLGDGIEPLKAKRFRGGHQLHTSQQQSWWIRRTTK